MASNLFDSLSPVAKFASGLFAAAGLNLSEMVAKGDVNALKAHIESAKSNQDLAQAITEATKSLTAQVETLTSEKANLSSSVATLVKHIGVKPEEVADEEKVKAAMQAKVTAEARSYLARHGHEIIPDKPESDPTKNGSKQSKTLAEFRAMNASDKSKFSALCREGKAEITGLPAIGPA